MGIKEELWVRHLGGISFSFDLLGLSCVAWGGPLVLPDLGSLGFPELLGQK